MGGMCRLLRFVLCTALLVGTSPGAYAAQQDDARATLLLTVTDPVGWTLPEVRVSLTGPVMREGATNASGMLRFEGLRPGTYRARFSGDRVVTFERDMNVDAGQAAELDVALRLAEPPVEPPPAPPLGPAGQPRSASLVSLIERELIGDDTPRRESLVACSGNTRSTVLQLNEGQPQRLYENAETSLYVIAGEGAARVDDREMPLSPGSFVSVPRGVPFTLLRHGRRPLILLSVLSGEPCEQAQ